MSLCSPIKLTFHRIFLLPLHPCVFSSRSLSCSLSSIFVSHSLHFYSAKMTTKTSINFSPMKRRCHGSPNFKKRRLASLLTQQQLTDLTFTLSYPHPLPTTITIRCNTSTLSSAVKLPDLLHDILMEQQQRRETIVNIAATLRKVGDQMDEQLQVIRSRSPSCKYLSSPFIENESFLLRCLDKQHFVIINRSPIWSTDQFVRLLFLSAASLVHVICRLHRSLLGPGSRRMVLPTSRCTCSVFPSTIYFFTAHI